MICKTASTPSIIPASMTEGVFFTTACIWLSSKRKEVREMKPNGCKTKGLNSWWLSSGMIFFLASAVGAEGVGENFLSHGPGANAGALGEAFTALADDATAMYYNPAGLPLQPGSGYAVHTPEFRGGRADFVGFQCHLHLARFGVAVVPYPTVTP